MATADLNNTTLPSASNAPPVVKFDGSKAMISREADELLGKFHAEIYSLSEAARAQGDPVNEAMSAYIHDRFCLVRCKLNDHEPPAEVDLSPRPTFVRAALSKAEGTR